ncbi:MAG: cytochrome c family protein [Gammaproteobacteria bacterium]
MTSKSRIGGFLEQAGLFFSVMFYVLFAWHQWWSGVSPRLIRGSPERLEIHHAHVNIGATLFGFLLIGLLIWLLRPGASLGTRFKNAFADVSSTAVSLFFISMLFAMLYGLGQSWAKDEATRFLGVFPLPRFLDWSWGTSGYMHSAFASTASALFSGMVFVYLFTKLRAYVKPGIAVALLMLLHLIVNLPKPPSLHPIAAFGTYVMTPTFYLIGLALYSWARQKWLVYWPVFLLFFVFFLYLPYFAFKVLPPWHVKPVAQTVLVESAETLAAIRPKATIFADDAALAAAREESSWCAQCHNFEPSDTHLLGPNLVAVFNRQAGTVDGYGRYSQPMIDAGLAGTFWTSENLTKYLADGQTFIPGNLMNQQTDLSDPQKMKQVIDYLEYVSSQ